MAASGPLPLSEREWRAHRRGAAGAARRLAGTAEQGPADDDPRGGRPPAGPHRRATGRAGRDRDGSRRSRIRGEWRAWTGRTISSCRFGPSVSGPAVTLPRHRQFRGRHGRRGARRSGSRREASSCAGPLGIGLSVPGRPLAVYASPRLTATLGLPPGASTLDPRARRPRAPSRGPGFGQPRVLYQALAEDLAVATAIGDRRRSHRRGAGRVSQRRYPGRHRFHPSSLAAASATRLADIRLILQLLTPAATERDAEAPMAEHRAHRRGRSLARRIDLCGRDAQSDALTSVSTSMDRSGSARRRGLRGP